MRSSRGAPQHQAMSEEIRDVEIEAAENTEAAAEPVAEPVTEEAVAEKPKRGRRKKEAASAEPEPAPASSRRSRPSRVIKSITGTLEAQTAESKAEAAWLEVMASLRNRRILKGEVFGVEVWEKMPCAVVMFRGIKVIIPAKEFLLKLPEDDDFNDYSPTYLRKTRNYIENRLGSEVEFIIVGFVDKSTQVVAASRCAAMKIRQREIFYRKARGTDEYLMKENSKVEVRVASALRYGLVVEIGGVDIFVPNDEVSWTRQSDVSELFHTGQKLVALVTKIDRSDPDNLDVEVSIKQATPNPFDKALRLLSTDRDAKYTGVVTLVDKKGIYVQLEDDIEVLCSFPRDGKIVAVGTRVALRVTEINQQWKLVRGQIVWNGGLGTVAN